MHTQAVVHARYFDGASSRPHSARLRIQDHRLMVEPTDAAGFEAFELPTRDVRWPERTRHGGRIAQLAGGASLQAVDVRDWDEWMGSWRSESWPVRLQQSWRGVLGALLALVVVLGLLYELGLPVVARYAADRIPWQTEVALGEQVLESIDGSLLEPSRLPLDQQQRIRSGFENMVRASHAEDALPAKLLFRRGAKGLGPNAMALPGGTIVLTDQLVELMPNHAGAVLGVLAHEFGHVQHRHVMRQVVQASALGVMASIVFGDFGALIGGAPALLATLGYSRDLEREADAESLRMMRRAGIPPRSMVDFFEAIEAWRDRQPSVSRDASVLDIAFASHPATAERIAFFGNAE
ncbi:Peptidase family M48 [Burkholderiales bacterium 8X]|nr:Peptidase family M48 [Burkholderiales bacterium 8X]